MICRETAFRRLCGSLLAALALAGFALQAGAQGWPSRPVRFVVPLPPGGGYDYIARALAERLPAALGVPFVVDNKPGAGARIGTDFVAKAPPDGHTLLMVASTHVIVPAMVAKLPYDAIRDFAAVSLVADARSMLVVTPDMPARSARELVAMARARPGSIAYGTSGVGSPFHFAAELLQSKTGIGLLHVPYKGTAPLIQALLAGEVATAFVPVGAFLQYVRSGKLRALANLGTSRFELLPEVPTMAEALPLPEYGMTGWMGVLAPAGTPGPAIDRLNAEINRLVRDPQFVKERLLVRGYEPVGSTPERFMEIMKEDLVMYARIVKEAKISAE